MFKATDCDTDYYLVVVKVRETISQPMTTNDIPRYNDQITYVQRIRCIKIVLQKQKK
jgi:hypothetical protein